MRRHINLERFLIAWSLAWLAALALRPALQETHGVIVYHEILK